MCWSTDPPGYGNWLTFIVGHETGPSLGRAAARRPYQWFDGS